MRRLQYKWLSQQHLGFFLLLCCRANKYMLRYSSSCGDHHLRATGCHLSYGITHPTQMNAPRLTPAMKAGTRFTYPGVDLVDLIAPQPGVEPATFRSRVRRRTAAPPRQPFMLLTPACWLHNTCIK